MKETSRLPQTSRGAGRAGTARPYGVCGMLSASAALMLGSAVLLSSPHAVRAQVVNDVWTGCELSADALAELESSMIASSLDEDEESPFGTLEVAFVVVYSINYDNDGQPILDDEEVVGHTGPVICRNSGVTIDLANQTDVIPSSGTVDILDAEEAFILRYEVNTGSAPEPIEKRFCHTVNSDTECFRVHGLPPPPPIITID